MESGFERVLSRAATIDDLLSDAYEPLPGQKADADIAARRLAAWCRASASGDWSLFAERLNGTAGRSRRFWPDSPPSDATLGSPGLRG